MVDTLVAPALDPATVQQVLLAGDLSRLSTAQRLSYYNSVCESLGLNPLTQPFAYLKLSGKEVLYAKRECAEQLRFLHNISIDPKTFTREVIEGIYVVTASATMPSGRSDVSTGAVAIEGLKGEARSNAMMKAETKAKRRVTLSICGLGMLDETEVESIPHARTAEQATLPAESVNTETGEIVETQTYAGVLMGVEAKRIGTRAYYEIAVDDGMFQTTDAEIITLALGLTPGVPVTVTYRSEVKGRTTWRIVTALTPGISPQ